MNFVLVAVGDCVTLRKPHPCGSFEWSVVRTGADIGLKCAACGRRVMLDRDEFERRVKSVRQPDPPPAPSAPSHGIDCQRMPGNPT